MQRSIDVTTKHFVGRTNERGMVIETKSHVSLQSSIILTLLHFCVSNGAILVTLGLCCDKRGLRGRYVTIERLERRLEPFHLRQQDSNFVGCADN